MSWQLTSFLILGAILVAGFAWYERSRPPSQVVALVAALTAMAIAGRVAFAAFPNVKPTTDIVVFAGYALGPAPGFAVGALTGLVSNFWFGQGPWTPWQMAGWGMCGVMGALLALGARNASRFTLAALCGFAGIAYGVLLNFSLMATYGGELSIQRFATLEARAIPFDAAHVAGNVVFALIAGPAMVRMLVRFRRRFEWRPLALAAALVALVLAPALHPAPARADAAAHAASWLAGEQNDDGGFGASPGDPSSVPVTGWAMLGLEAAGRNPFDVAHQGKTPIDYLRSRLDDVKSSGDLARTVVALEGAGADPRSFGGRNLVSDLLDRRAANGSFEGWPATTAYCVVALRAAGATGGLDQTLSWLAKVQNGDGGWGDNPGDPSNADVTAAAMQAMPDAKVAEDGLAYLRRHQHSDGGFALGSAGGTVNSQSTGWAVQAMIAVGADPARIASHGHSALDYLAARQARDGHYRYSESSDQTAVWVTSEALVGVAGDSIPIEPPPRQRESPEKASGGSGSSGGVAASEKALRELALGQGKSSAPGAGHGGGASPGVPLPQGSTVAPEPDAGAQSPGTEAEAEGSTAAFTETTGSGGPSPWIAIGIGAACTALAIGATWLLGRRFGW